SHSSSTTSRNTGCSTASTTSACHCAIPTRSNCTSRRGPAGCRQPEPSPATRSGGGLAHVGHLACDPYVGELVREVDRVRAGGQVLEEIDDAHPRPPQDCPMSF